MTGRAAVHYPADGVSWRGVVLWSTAGALAFVLHVGGAAWALRPQAMAPAEAAPPAAIMIELAPEPVAQETEEQEIAVDQEDSEPVDSEPIEEPKPEETVEPEPFEEPAPTEVEEAPEEMPKEEADPVQEMVETPLENVEVPIPTPRPEPPPRRVEKREPVKRAEQPQQRKPRAPARAANQAAVQAEESDRTAATRTNRGSTRSSVSPARWQSQLIAHLERRKRYPSGARSRREQGTAYVRFTIDVNGNVGSVSLARSSGYPELDQEVVSMVRRASPVPAPPPGVNRTITAPVRFNLR